MLPRALLQHHRYVGGCLSVLNACSQGPCPKPCRLSTPNVSRDLPEHPDQCCSSACKRVSRKVQGHPSARTALLLLFERLQGTVRGRFQGGLCTQQCRSVLLGTVPVPRLPHLWGELSGSHPVKGFAFHQLFSSISRGQVPPPSPCCSGASGATNLNQNVHKSTRNLALTCNSTKHACSGCACHRAAEIWDLKALLKLWCRAFLSVAPQLTLQVSLQFLLKFIDTI